MVQVNWQPGVRIKCSKYQRDHMIHRTSDEIIAWCGRPLYNYDEGVDEDSNFEIGVSDRRGDGTLCNECKTKESAYFENKKRNEADRQRGMRSGW